MEESYQWVESGKNVLRQFMRALNSNYLFKFSIIIPFGNIKDLEKIEPELKKKVQFYPVKEIKDVLSVAFPTLWESIPPKL